MLQVMIEPIPNLPQKPTTITYLFFSASSAYFNFSILTLTANKISFIELIRVDFKDKLTHSFTRIPFLFHRNLIVSLTHCLSSLSLEDDAIKEE
jgi:hypothetical protein